LESVAAKTLVLKDVCPFAIPDTTNAVAIQTEGCPTVAKVDDQTEKAAMPAFAALDHLETINTRDVGLQVIVQVPS
jgi:hypothetical protein